MKRLLMAALVLLFAPGLTPAAAQERKGTISGHVTDPNQDPFVGARVELQPSGNPPYRTPKASSKFPT